MSYSESTRQFLRQLHLSEEDIEQIFTERPIPLDRLFSTSYHIQAESIDHSPQRETQEVTTFQHLKVILSQFFTQVKDGLPLTLEEDDQQLIWKSPYIQSGMSVKIGKYIRTIRFWQENTIIRFRFEINDRPFSCAKNQKAKWNNLFEPEFPFIEEVIQVSGERFRQKKELVTLDELGERFLYCFMLPEYTREIDPDYKPDTAAFQVLRKNLDSFQFRVNGIHFEFYFEPRPTDEVVGGQFVMRIPHQAPNE